MAGIVERSQNLKREDLSDLLTVIDKRATPLLSQIRRGSAPRNSLIEWGLDSHKVNMVQAATYTSGVSDQLPIDGADITSDDFENYDNRVKCQMYVQYARRVPKVSRLANMVSDIAGVGYKKEMSRSISKALTTHKRDLESTLCSSQECAAETATSPYQTRGLGKYIQSGAQAVNAIPAEFRTPTGSIKSVAGASNAAEEDIRDILQSIYDQTGEANKTFFGLCGTTMKQAISNMSLFTSRTDNIVVSNRDTDTNRLNAAIDIIDSDFGTVTLNLSSYLEQQARSGGSYDASVGKGTLYILNTDQLEVAFAEDTSVRELQDNGGGARSIIESVFALKSYSGGADHGKYDLNAA